jgi:hypothetical protein
MHCHKNFPFKGSQCAAFNDRGSCLPVAINNAVGSQRVSLQDLAHSGAETNHDPHAPHPDSPVRPDGGFSVPYFNSWASQRSLHLRLMETGQHPPA